MNSPSIHRLLFAVLPALITGTVVVSTIWGESGLLARHRLKQELVEAQRDLAAVERDNQRLLRDLKLMERDPVVLERVMADELLWGREDAVLYRFEDDQAPR